MSGSTQQNAATLPSIADTLLAAATTRQKAVRKHVVASAKDAVVLRGKYKDMDVDNRTTALHRDRENLITELANNKRDTTLRLLYIQLVISLGRMHIYDLYPTPKSYLLPIRFNNFYSMLLHGSRSDTRSTCPDYEGFSPEEFKKLEEAKGQSMEFIIAALKWEQARKLFWKENSMSEDLFFTQDGLNLSYIEDFKRTFQNPFDARVVVKAADGYLTHVEKMVRVFRDVFAVDA